MKRFQIALSTFTLAIVFTAQASALPTDGWEAGQPEPTDTARWDSPREVSEIVVVGYGTQNRTQLTGSVATVQAAQIQAIPAPTLDAAIGGLVTGVDVTANGQPGAGSTIRIRGGNSVNASNNPLYVIDGFIYQMDQSAQKTGIGSMESTLDPLSFINPADI